MFATDLLHVPIAPLPVSDESDWLRRVCERQEVRGSAVLSIDNNNTSYNMIGL